LADRSEQHLLRVQQHEHGRSQQALGWRGDPPSYPEWHNNQQVGVAINAYGIRMALPMCRGTCTKVHGPHGTAGRDEAVTIDPSKIYEIRIVNFSYGSVRRAASRLASSSSPLSRRA